MASLKLAVTGNGECQIHECSDGLFLVSKVEVIGRTDERYAGVVRDGGVETTVLYFDRKTLELLKEWYRA